MANRRVSVKGKGADLFFGGNPAADVLEALTEQTIDPAPVPVEEAPSESTNDQEIETVSKEATKRPARTPRNHDTVVPRHHDTTVETIRRAVRLPGKEAATYRLTQDEKSAVADIIYTYKRSGTRTSEIEISRIALNFILTDYEENGDESILARVLKALHE